MLRRTLLAVALFLSLDATPALATPTFAGGTLAAAVGANSPVYGGGYDTNEGAAPGTVRNSIGFAFNAIVPRTHLTAEWLQGHSITLTHEAWWDIFTSSSSGVILGSGIASADPIQMVLSAPTDLALDLTLVGVVEGSLTSALRILSVDSGDAVVAETTISAASGVLSNQLLVSLGPGAYTLGFNAFGVESGSFPASGMYSVVGSVSVVPEPSTAVLASCGLMGLSLQRRRVRLARDRRQAFGRE